jgi:hypothetical protein
MTCVDCKKPVSNPIYHETNRLCYPCYRVWTKADEEAFLLDQKLWPIFNAMRKEEQ